MDEHSLTEEEALAEIAAYLQRPERPAGWYTVREIAAQMGVKPKRAAYLLDTRPGIEVMKDVYVDGQLCNVYRIRRTGDEGQGTD